MALEDDTFEFIVGRIFERMDEVGLTPIGLSTAAGMERNYIRGPQRGLKNLAKRGLPKHASLQKLSGPLRCSIEYLIGNTDDPSFDVGGTVAVSRPRTTADVGPADESSETVANLVDRLAALDVRSIRAIREFLIGEKPLQGRAKKELLALDKEAADARAALRQRVERVE